MHAIKLNITDERFEKFMGLIDILPKESIKIEEIDHIPYYPAISFEDAQQKVQTSIADIPKNKG
ncbi:MAG TPA: hypothetical protein ENK77_01295, partial [Epsilonproteobacteria bacterium]|nr:hypothetical protein [Campylobacterota bacterium]